MVCRAAHAAAEQLPAMRPERFKLAPHATTAHTERLTAASPDQLRVQACR